MRLKLSFLIIVFLMSFSLQSKNKVSDIELVRSVSAHARVKRNAVIRYAKKQLGTPYRFAGSNPEIGFDCSGFVSYVFKKFKIKLPRSSREYKSLGKALKPKEFKVGDVLVFYGFNDKTRIGHVGIICEAAGMNSRFIHSSSGKARGVIISNLGSEMYSRHFYKCINVIHEKKKSKVL